MEMIFGGVALALSIIGSSVGLGMKIGGLSGKVSAMKETLDKFTEARNGGTQCQRHEDAIAELRRDVDGLGE